MISSSSCDNYISKLIFEVVWIAIIMTILGATVYHALNYFFLINNIKEIYLIYTSFTLSGILLHLICELLGVNKWYVLHSAAAACI